MCWSSRVSRRNQSCEFQNKVDLAWSSSIPRVSSLHQFFVLPFCRVLQANKLPPRIPPLSLAVLSCAFPIRPTTAVPTKSLSRTPAKPTLQSMPSSIPSLRLFHKKCGISDNVSWKSLILRPLRGRCTDGIVIFVHNGIASHLVPRDCRLTCPPLSGGVLPDISVFPTSSEMQCEGRVVLFAKPSCVLKPSWIATFSH